MIAKIRTMKALRNVVLALTFTLMGATSTTNSSVAQAQASSPTTTGVMVILTVKANVTREDVMAVMPADTRDVAEAQIIMEGLPLARKKIVDHEYIAVGPLLPLRLLMATPERQQ
jgi:hypothetical protein